MCSQPWIRIYETENKPTNRTNNGIIFTFSTHNLSIQPLFVFLCAFESCLWAFYGMLLFPFTIFSKQFLVDFFYPYVFC